MCFGSVEYRNSRSVAQPAAPLEKAPVVANPDSSEARTNRLDAAVQDTGYSLEQRVQITGCGRVVIGSGKVVGFGRVNAPGQGANEEPKRFVLVHLNTTAVSGSLRVNIAAIDPQYLKPE